MTANPVRVACPACSLPMKLGDHADLAACRCGLFVDLDGNGAPVPPFRQGEPWKEREPGIRITDQYRDLAEVCWETIDVDPFQCATAATLSRACADAFECSGLRYVGKPKHGARTLILDSGENLQRQPVYALVPLGKEAEAVAAIVRFIRNKHGTGRLWAHGDMPIGPLKRRHEDGHRGAVVGGVMHVVLGCYYFHQPDADVESTRSIDAALDLHAQQRRFDREFPRTPISVGDHVRWWPDVTELGTPAEHAKYIDGVVAKFDPLCLRVTGSRWFTERIPGGWSMPAVGGLVDTSISPGLVRRRPYAPSEKMTDRHPDSVIAQVVEETIAEHQRRHAAGEAFRGVDRSASPEKLSGAVLAGGLAPIDWAKLQKAPATPGRQQVTPVRLDNEVMAAVAGDVGCFDSPSRTRPDGFDQRQVDAARAALLAAAPPRYPRTR